MQDSSSSQTSDSSPNQHTASFPLVIQARDGAPEVCVTDKHLDLIVADLKSGSGPIAWDAERASGFKYRQRAYLIQLRREGSGTHLIDPTAFDDLKVLQTATIGIDWIVHAASQDLVCLAEVGLVPTKQMFDTELGARILGHPRVGLGTLVEYYIGVSLAKEHSAADWSKRPLPESWLHYAALDVDYLVDIWTAMSQELHASNKYEIAIQEFEHVRDSTTPIVRQDPWRRVSGLHKVTSPADLAVVRALWQARDGIAQDQDIAPGRLLPDSAIVSLALSGADDEAMLGSLTEITHRGSRRNADLWVKTIVAARRLSSEDLPESRVKGLGIPAPRTWAVRNPAAWTRLEAARKKISELSESLNIPVENLMTPDTVRKVIWLAPDSCEQMTSMLVESGARTWQIESLAPVFEEVLDLSCAH